VVCRGAHRRYIKDLIFGQESAGQLSGPIRIAEVSGEMAKISLAALLNLAAVLQYPSAY
jgi:regulator of sigma E protease